MRKIILILSVTTLWNIGLFANNSTKAGTESDSITSIVLSSDINSLQKNDSAKLTITIVPKEVTADITLSSKNGNTIKEVNNQWVVYPVKNGEDTITAKTKDGNHTGTCSITVSGVNDTVSKSPNPSTTKTIPSQSKDSIKLDNHNISLTMNGNSILLKAASNKNLNWKSKHNNVIVMLTKKTNTEYKISPNTVGGDTIIVSVIDNLTISDSCIVKVNPNQAFVDSITIHNLNDSIIKLNTTITNCNTQIVNLETNKNNSFILICVFAVLALVFITLFILEKIDPKKQKKIRQREIKDTTNEEEGWRKENVELKKNVDSLSYENKRLKNENKGLQEENQAFRDEIAKDQQMQKTKDRLQTPPEQPSYIPSPPPQPQLLYADSIFEGKFNHVSEKIDDDPIFELKLDSPNGTSATVRIHEPSYRRVIANPAFLVGCEKYVLGNTTVTLLREGKAVKESDGKWKLTIVPEVQIS